MAQAFRCKRLLCCILAIMLLCMLGASDASAASAYYIRFYDTTTAAESDNTRIVEGSSINIRAKLPDSHQFDAKTPFSVKKKGSNVPEPNPENFFNISPNNKLNYTLIAQPNSADRDAGVYSLEAMYTANLTEGTGSGIYTDPSGTSNDQFALRIVSDSAVSITENGQITFTSITDQTIMNMVTFSNATASGGLSNYNNGVITPGPVSSDSNGRFMKLYIASTTTNPKPFEAKMYFEGLPSTYTIKKGTKFEINFLMQTLNSMILTVITPQRAVEETVNSVRENPTDSSVTVSNKPYIALEKGETLLSIKNNFTMLRRVHRDNVDIELEWEWVPDNSAHQDNIAIRTNLPTVATFDIRNRPKEDMSGALHVVAKYAGKTSSVASIPILIYGTGTPPSVTALNKFTGNPGATPNPKEETITKMPDQMDVYRGDADSTIYPTKPLGAYQFVSVLEYGSGRGAAKTLKINNLGGGGEVEIRIDNSSVPYVLGSPITNAGSSHTIEITASKQGQITLQFEYYDANGDEMKPDWQLWKAYIQDSRPSTDGRLASLGVNLVAASREDQDLLDKVYQNPTGYIDYGFNPDTNTYNFTVPNKSSQVKIWPRIPNGTGASNKVLLYYDGTGKDLTSGNGSAEIDLAEQRTKSILVTVTAEDGSKNTYTLMITRSGKETNSQLKSFTAKQVGANATDLVQGFKPDLLTYDISVPYSVEEVVVSGSTKSTWATALFDPAVGTFPGGTPTCESAHSKTVALSCDYDPVADLATNNITKVTLRVIAEDGTSTTDYILNVTRLAPSDNRRLSLLSVQDETGVDIPFLANQKFSPDSLDYSINIPYSAQKITITAQPEDGVAKSVTLTQPAIYGGNAETKDYHSSPLLFKKLDVTQEATHNPSKDLFTYNIAVAAESTNLTDPPYTIEVMRLLPNTDNTLSALAVTDEDGKPVPDYVFRTDTYEYDIQVPYLTRSVNIAPVTSVNLSTVEVDGQKITPKRPSVNMKLKEGEKKTIPVVVTAESGDVISYLLRITRSMPSTEARLAKLDVAGLTLKPTFVPSKLEYEVTMPKEMQSYTLTPTAIDPNATITINEKTIASGGTTSPITPDMAESTAEILVTAQDGLHKKVYKVKILAEGLFPSSDNADLSSLAVKEGSMTPAFKPGTFSYEVAVKNDTAAVDIFPTLAESHASLKVLSGTKELGDYNGNYSTALTSDKTDLTIEVESQDKTKKREYKVTVYRNTDGKQGIYKPITADMVDYETNDPIIVDISVYPIVAADVFNKLKEDYPDKTMILKGNDYAFEFKGSDIKQLVPNTELFDFSLSFTSPEEPQVRSLLDRTGNGGLQPVYVYFTHHGPLPAAMKFTLSLGSAYKNQVLYWNYYNTERDRIDFYGTVQSNTQGTFSLQMSHMSTYLVTTTYINGAEDKSGLESGVNGSLSSSATSGKRNPSTTAGKDATS